MLFRSEFDEDDGYEPPLAWEPVYWCTECGKRCTVYTEDEGIGDYEYWGSRERDSRLVDYSDCCDAEVTTREP